MDALIFSSVVTSTALFVHWLVWRVSVPRRQTRALLAVFVIVAAGVVCLCTAYSDGQHVWRPGSAWEWLHVGLFYIATTLAYVVVYSALEERSPSMTLLGHVAGGTTSGRTRQELEAILSGMCPVEVRLEALVRDGLVEEQGGTYRLTAKGRQWAETFEAARRILGFGKGG